MGLGKNTSGRFHSKEQNPLYVNGHWYGLNCITQNLYVEALTPSIPECDCI